MYSNPIKDWFYFSRRQRRGIRVMLVMLLLVPLFSGVVRRNIQRPSIDHERFLEEVDAFNQQLARLEQEAAELAEAERLSARQSYAQRISAPQLTPHPFDPNIISREEWESMGVSARLARSIRNFVAAGGSFRFREDLRRIYLMDDVTYDQLADYILLPERASRDRQATGQTDRLPAHEQIAENRSHGSQLKDHDTNISGSGGYVAATEPLIININAADTTELMRIRGIGPAFSRRIVSYRDILGGYHCTSQLLEVFGMDSTRFEQIKSHVMTDTIHIQKLNLNTAEFGDLVRHPYIDRNTANVILNLRRQHGPFRTPEEITQSYLVNDSIWGKIRPYMAVE